MAAIDYGTIVTRNGEFVNVSTRFMKKTDLGLDVPKCVGNTDMEVCGNYFAYVGNPNDIMFCFYKHIVDVIQNNTYIGRIYIGEAGSFNIPSTEKNRMFLTKSPYEKIFNIFGTGVTMTFECIDKNIQHYNNGYWDETFYTQKFKVSFEYAGNNYVVYTGYGIDTDPNVYKDITESGAYDYTETEIEELNKVFGI